MRTREDLRLSEAAMTLIRLMEDEAVGWETDDPVDDGDEIDLDRAMLRWWGKPMTEAWRQLKDAARG